MPIRPNMSKSAIVKEVLDNYKKTGKIGNTRPKNKRSATKIAVAIASKNGK